MTAWVPVLLGVLAIWLIVCVWTGYKQRYILAVATLLVGLALNMIWMVLGLQAHPFEVQALIAQASLMVYGFCTFGMGWVIGRLVRSWRATAVDRRSL